MRHLRVPNLDVERVLSLLREREWLASGMRVFSQDDAEFRFVPLDPASPIALPAPFDKYETELHAGQPDNRIDSDWWNHLTNLLGAEVIATHGEAWPSSHEFISDMMIVRIEDGLEKFSAQIAEAKLLSHPHIRLILNDEGVQGELRIRKLTPIGARVDGAIVTEGIPDSVSSTRVLVRESGKSIACDPNKAYFSTKLQSERLETLALARELREVLGRSLRVCDPFCGVGPSLAVLLSEPGLVSEVLASDLNPYAVDLLMDNLRRWDGRTYPMEPAPISRIFEDRIIGVADATQLQTNPEFTGRWDLLIVNLPHRTLDILHSLVPLLDRENPSMVRGRVIVPENEIENANQSIRRDLPDLLGGFPDPTLKVKRDYSSKLRLCSFQAWIAPLGD
tara:strand:+ start:475 stop:1653 length:1179 start_codon:yes stop_codon:yes gene_type:complete